jgi:hypothetical protein
MFICCSRLLSFFLPTVYCGHLLLALVLGNEQQIFPVSHVTRVGTCPNVLGYTSLSESTSQWYAVAIPGIKLLHLVHTEIVSVDFSSLWWGWGSLNWILIYYFPCRLCRFACLFPWLFVLLAIWANLQLMFTFLLFLIVTYTYMFHPNWQFSCAQVVT